MTITTRTVSPLERRILALLQSRLGLFYGSEVLAELPDEHAVDVLDALHRLADQGLVRRVGELYTISVYGIVAMAARGGWAR